jgi:hypothetical protein
MAADKAVEANNKEAIQAAIGNASP